MKNSIVRVMTALCAFLVGVSSSQLRSLWQYKVARPTPIVNIKVVDQPATASAVEPWRRIVVKDRFAFYIPPDLNDDGHSANRRMAVGAFRKSDRSGLFHLYYYSDRDIGDDPSEASPRYRFTRKSEVMLGGKRAIVVIEIPADDEITCIHDVPEVLAYFPEIGRGQKLYLRLASGDAQGIEVAKRILDSIEFF